MNLKLTYVIKHVTYIIGVKNSFWTLQTRPHVRHCSSHVRESSQKPSSRTFRVKFTYAAEIVPYVCKAKSYVRKAVLRALFLQ